MQDFELIRETITVLKAGLAARSLNDALIQQAFQPTQQGTPTPPSIQIYKLNDDLIGHPKIKDVWDRDQEIMVHTESQWMAGTFQLSTLKISDPKMTSQINAFDLASICVQILNGEKGRLALKAKGIGIDRISQIRNPFFKDDRERFEAQPSFDFTLTHEQVIILASPVVETTEFNIKRV